ncbi:hypothetical protein TNCV_1051351 [Trichonephila clavipes]|nr:hypothetical protein TNCV_1051351 [Trichonephila clavipes]
MHVKSVELKRPPRWCGVVVRRGGASSGVVHHLTMVQNFAKSPRVAEHCDVNIQSINRHHIDDFMRGRIIGKIEEGRKITDVAREFDIAHSVVSRLWKSFKTTGMCVDGKNTTPAETDISSYHKTEQAHHSSAQISFLLPQGKQISRKLLPDV